MAKTARAEKVLSAKPIRSEVKWEVENDRVIITFKKQFTRFERFLQRWLKGPENIRVRLDEKGSYIWHLCDGKHSIKDICRKVDERYKEAIEPVGPRVTRFLTLLLQRNLIRLEPEKLEK